MVKENALMSSFYFTVETIIPKASKKVISKTTKDILHTFSVD